MHTEKRISDIDWRKLLAGKTFHASPAHWEDEVLYFFLVDRFSNGKERGYRGVNGQLVNTGTAELYQQSDNGNAIRTEADAAKWREAGKTFLGGTLAGAATKLGYLKRLGISAVWLSPVFKQVAIKNTYHGYGVQDFLDVDPNFGAARDDLRDFVAAAHQNGIRVILDIILNHAGDVFEYSPDRYLTRNQNGSEFLDPRWDGRNYAVKGYRDSKGNASLPFGDLVQHPTAFPDGGVWPAELQAPATFTQKGHISNFDYDPEYLEGDFFDLKDVHHGTRTFRGGIDHLGEYQVSPALLALCDVFKFWIAFADLDGFRIDTVKHIDPGAARFFASAIQEFADRIGKDNFLLVGEIAGGRDKAFTILEQTGLSAALGIDDVSQRMTEMVQGQRNPQEYFDLFRNSVLVNQGSHTWFRDKVVTQVDDHDQLWRKDKARFCANANPSLALPVVAMNLLTLGIPCIYYGTEQQFDGKGGGDFADRYIREAMFGGEFGAFRTRGVHFFDESGSTFQETAKLCDLRRKHPALRRGRQYLREISGDGAGFGYPVRGQLPLRSIVGWSRILDNQEYLAALNTDSKSSQAVWVTVDGNLHRAGDKFTSLYPIAGIAATVEARNGCAVKLTLPPAGISVLVAA